MNFGYLVSFRDGRFSYYKTLGAARAQANKYDGVINKIDSGELVANKKDKKEVQRYPYGFLLVNKTNPSRFFWFKRKSDIRYRVPTVAQTEYELVPLVGPPVVEFMTKDNAYLTTLNKFVRFD